MATPRSPGGASRSRSLSAGRICAASSMCSPTVRRSRLTCGVVSPCSMVSRMRYAVHQPSSAVPRGPHAAASSSTSFTITLPPGATGQRQEQTRQGGPLPTRWDGLFRSIEDGRIDLASNTVQRSSSPLDPVQIAVQADLEHRRRVIGRAARLGRRHPGKPQFLQIQRVNERLNGSDRVILRYIIIKRCWQQKALAATCAFDETSR